MEYIISPYDSQDKGNPVFEEKETTELLPIGTMVVLASEDGGEEYTGHVHNYMFFNKREDENDRIFMNCYSEIPVLK